MKCELCNKNPVAHMVVIFNTHPNGLVIGAPTPNSTPEEAGKFHAPPMIVRTCKTCLPFHIAKFIATTQTVTTIREVMEKPTPNAPPNPNK